MQGAVSNQVVKCIIYTNDFQIGKAKMESIISEYAQRGVSITQQRRGDCCCEVMFDNEEEWIVVKPNSSARGYRWRKAWVDVDTVTGEQMNHVIRPCGTRYQWENTKEFHGLSLLSNHQYEKGTNIMNKTSNTSTVTYDCTEENKIRNLLIGRSVVCVDKEKDTLELDDGTLLTIVPNMGCPGCGSGDYRLTDLNSCRNVITNVEFIVEEDDEEDSYDPQYSYKIFVFAEDKRITLAQVDGYDGNGYYGSGYEVVVTTRNVNNGE